MTDMFFTDGIENKKILLHACCGPCSLGAIEPLLTDGADITLFFYNPCIIDGEFEKRLDALRTVAEYYGLPVIVPPHDHASYLGYAAPHASDKEGGGRCSYCFGDRIKTTGEYAAAHGFDIFTTTLTVSPHKDASRIFGIGGMAAQACGVPFLARDFKKRDGFLRSTRLSKELGIYRQKFCGCEYSLPVGGDA